MPAPSLRLMDLANQAAAAGGSEPEPSVARTWEDTTVRNMEDGNPRNTEGV